MTTRQHDPLFISQATPPANDNDNGNPPIEPELAEPETVETSDVIKSVSLEALTQNRDDLLARLASLFDDITALDQLSRAAHAGAFRDWFFGNQSGYHHALRAKDPLEFCRVRIDATIWHDLMNESGVRSYMDHQARDQWDHAIEQLTTPPLTQKNVEATFEALRDRRGDMFERGVIGLFQSLSWNYKTNLPHMLGQRMILERMVEGWDWGRGTWHLNDDNQHRLTDLDRVMRILDGKQELDHRDDIRKRVLAGFNEAQSLHRPTYDDEYYRIKGFKKGTIHITLKRQDLVERLNKMIAKHYPNALPAQS